MGSVTCWKTYYSSENHRLNWLNFINKTKLIQWVHKNSQTILYGLVSTKSIFFKFIRFFK
jgi:hypothetical protein